MINKQYDINFDVTNSGRPYIINPTVFGDNRGSFSEVLVGDDLKGIKQINRSVSSQYVLRGLHAQKSPFCQSKLVEAINQTIFDVIIDARPDSKTFGMCCAYELNPKRQNKLYVPQGFLHSFIVPRNEDDLNSQAIFMYYCNNVYDKTSEICVNPKVYFEKLFKNFTNNENNMSDVILEEIKAMFNTNNIILSDKDLQGQDYETFMMNIMNEYKKTKNLWYI